MSSYLLNLGSYLLKLGSYLSSATTAGPSPAAPLEQDLNSEIVFVGDSMTYGNNGQPNAYFQWLQIETNGFYYLPPDANQGVSGQTSSEIATRIQSFPRSPDTVMLLMGENDGDSVTLEGMKSNFESVFTKFSGSEAIYVLPQAYTTSVDASPSKTSRRSSLNSWLSSVSEEFSNVIYLGDAWDGIDLLGSDSHDGVHPNVSGARKLASNIAGATVSHRQAGTAYDIPEYQGANLIPSTSGGDLSGVGGSISNGTGDVANNWQVSNNSGATLVASKGVQNGQNSQILVYSGTASSGSNTRARLSVTTPPYVPGKLVQLFSTLQLSGADGVSGASGIEGFGIEVYYGNVTWLSQYYTGSQGSFDQVGFFNGTTRIFPELTFSSGSTITIDFVFQLVPGPVDVRLEFSNVQLFMEA